MQMGNYWKDRLFKICRQYSIEIRFCQRYIHVFTDRIEFMNAGSFPIPPEKMFGTLYSSSRNPTIAKLFRFAKLSENIGFGINKMMSWKTLTGNDVTIRNEKIMSW